MKIQNKTKTWFLLSITLACAIGVICGVTAWSQHSQKDANAASTSDLRGKAVLFDGDSIAMGSAATGVGSPGGRWSYANYIEDTYSINKTNISYAGARFYWPSADSDCSDGTKNCHIIPNHLTSTIKNTSYDYIILEGAINDLRHNYASDSSKYSAELRKYFQTITENSKWANSKIGFVIVPRPDYSRQTIGVSTQGIEEFWQEVQSICDEYSIEYINFFKQTSNDNFIVPNGFNWNFMTTVANDIEDVGSFDGLHPSKGAHRILGEHIANWVVNLPNYKYSVTFDSNGSSVSNVAAQSVVHGKTAVQPTYNIDSDQHFSHWSTSKGGNAYNFGSAVNGNIKLYAIWSVNVTFNTNGGTLNGESEKLVSISGGSKVTNPGTPQKSGYTFKGWFADAACTTEFDFGSAVSRDITTYACWDKGYTLTLDANGGINAPTPQSCIVIRNDTCNIIISSSAPSRAGHYFLGYADTADAVAAQYEPGNRIVLSDNKTIYAVWADGDTEWKDDGKKHTIGDGNNMVVRINYPMTNFVKLMVDNAEVDNTENTKYKIESGSTIITIYASYLDTLAPGNHTLQAVYDNGAIKETDFVIESSGGSNTSSDTEEESTITDGSNISGGGEENLSVPNTGGNVDDEGNEANMLYIIPVLSVGGIILCCKQSKASRHRKFE